MTQSPWPPFILFFLLILPFSLLPLQSQGKVNSDTGGQGGVLVQGHGFDGVIFPAKMKAFQGQFPKGISYWTPSEAEVTIAEQELMPFLQKTSDGRVPAILKTISRYKRQYSGIILGGHKLVYINLFCEADGTNWTREEIFVLDGGSCYFNLRFSIETKQFSHLQINGLA